MTGRARKGAKVMENRTDIMDLFDGLPGEEAEAGSECGRFVIDSDAKAEWAIRKIAAEEAERDRLVAVCKEEIDRYSERKKEYEERCEGRVSSLKGLLREYFATITPKETKTQQKYELPSGSLILKKESRDYRPDPDKLREWLEKCGMADYLKTEVSPRWALVKKQLSTLEDGSIVFGETGEIMPEGLVEIEEKPASFEVRHEVSPQRGKIK